MNTITVRLPDSLHEASQALVKQEHISMNQFIVSAVSEKFLEERAKRGNREKFLKVLKNAPDVEPEEFDKL